MDDGSRDEDQGISAGAAAGAVPLLSVVIPALNEAEGIGGLLEDLGSVGLEVEVIVVDGGSRDSTVEIAKRFGARVVSSAPGRGEQLSRGAEVARASLFCFLHADVRLPRHAGEALRRLALARRSGTFAFRLRIDAEGLPFRIVELTANMRSRWLGLPYGDQGLIVSREHYLAAGGYPPIPLMEDVALVRALRSSAPVQILDEFILVSARRWQRYGVARRTLRNWSLMVRFLRGADPHRLAAEYRAESHRV